jgi:hypothetical protein
LKGVYESHYFNKLLKKSKEIESEQRFEHQLFIGKVTCIIGFDKTLELINESKLEILSFNSCKYNNK